MDREGGDDSSLAEFVMLFGMPSYGNYGRSGGDHTELSSCDIVFCD